MSETASGDTPVAAVAAARQPRQLVVGFAAETHDALATAAAKRAAKGLDLIVVNDVTEPGAGFGGPDNHVTLLDEAGPRHLSPRSKLQVAHTVLEWVAARRDRRAHG